METQNPSATDIHCFAAVDAIGTANRRTMVGSGVSEQQFAQNPNSNSTFLLPPQSDIRAFDLQLTTRHGTAQCHHRFHSRSSASPNSCPPSSSPP
ncbi:hypothetical protein EV1_031275 [Malus domestica]